MSLLKGLYFTSVNKDHPKNKRIIDKCLGQIDVFTSNNWSMDFVSQSDQGYLMNEFLISTKSNLNSVQWLQEKLGTLLGNYRNIKKNIDPTNYDFVYFRHSFFNPATIRFFKWLKKKKPTLLIIVEISTYPYQQEYDTSLKKILSLIDTRSGKHLKYTVDYVASCSPEETILGVPVIHFSNGLLHIPKENIASVQNLSNKINAVAIASNISYWHGFDRVIKGLATYKKNGGNGFTLDIIGAGSALADLKSLTNKLALEDIISFKNEIPTKDVIPTLASYSLGFSTLGMHRKSVAYDSSMKSRDYAYAGLPFILCADDLSFPKEEVYWKYFHNDDRDIDIQKCVDFIEQLSSTESNYSDHLKQYATKHLKWKNTFSKIVTCIKTFSQKPYAHNKLFSFHYYFPPIKAIGSIRNYCFNNQMKKKGFETKIFSTSNAHKCFTNEELFEDQLPTTHIPTIDFRTLVEKPKTNNPDKKSNSSGGNKFILKILNSFPINIILGEGGFIYILKAYKAAKKEINNGSIIYSSFRPYSDHIIAYLLKRKFSSLYWIADFRDLHYDKHINDFYIGRFQNWCNKKIVEKASIVTTVSIGLQEKLLAYNPNVYVLRNGMIEEKRNSEIKHYKKFTINYTGSLYEGKRDAQTIFKAINNLIKNGKIDASKIALQYAGAHSSIWDKWAEENHLASINNSLGMVSTAEAMDMQKRSHINVLLSWCSEEVSGILTGKFYEYLNTKNPIILIISGLQDKEFENVFEETNCGRVFYNSTDINIISSYIENLYIQWQKDNNLGQFKSKVRNENYQWSELIKQFYLDKL